MCLCGMIHLKTWQSRAEQSEGPQYDACCLAIAQLQATQVAAQLASGRMTVLLVDEKQQDEHESVMRMNVLTE